MSDEEPLVLEEKEVIFRPGVNIVQGSPIDILIGGTVGEYINLNACLLWVKIKLVLADGTAPGDRAVAPVNNILHSMWSSVEVEINGRSISGHGLHYPYRAYLEKLLSYSAEAMEYNLYCEGFSKDTAGQMDTAVLTLASDNKELSARALRFNSGASVELCGRLHLDIFHQERLLPPSTVRVVLMPNAGKRCLMSLTPNQPADQVQYRVQIEECHLLLKKIVFAPDVTLQMMQQHLEAPIIYSLRVPELKFLTLASGSTTYRETFITASQIPQRVFIGLISRDAHNGRYQANPFNFQHF